MLNIDVLAGPKYVACRNHHVFIVQTLKVRITYVSMFGVFLTWPSANIIM